MRGGGYKVEKRISNFGRFGTWETLSITTTHSGIFLCEIGEGGSSSSGSSNVTGIVVNIWNSCFSSFSFLLFLIIKDFFVSF